MANNLSINPYNLDTAGEVVSSTNMRIEGIVPVPSGATWSVILHDKNGKVIYSANNNGGIPITPLPFKAEGLKPATLTSASVLVWFSNLA